MKFCERTASCTNGQMVNGGYVVGLRPVARAAVAARVKRKRRALRVIKKKFFIGIYPVCARRYFRSSYVCALFNQDG